MILTIGMIVKNEEKWLNKCLSAIKPILDNVDSELIITDTGSTDKTVEIAKIYTDNVLHFDWCNDFAAARNTGIKAAHGKWYMFIDADEIFQSCNGIINFFNSGEYKKYNSAAYTIRNMQSDGSYSDFEARRMTKLLPETHFTGVIHEHFSTHGEPVKYISDISNHYGYIYNNESERIQKYNRNYILLKDKFKQIKDTNPMIYAEMYDTLALGKRQAEADDYLETGIKWCIKHEHPILILLYCKKARHLLFEQQTENALKICDEYFSMGINIRPTVSYSDIEILAIKSTALYRLEKYDEAIETLISFFEAYADAKSGKLNTCDKMYGALNLASDSKYLSYVGQFLICCINSGKYDFAAEYIEKLPLREYCDNKETLKYIIGLEINVLNNTSMVHLDDFCANLDDYGKQELKSAVGKLSKDKVVLTVGMIVKNEEKWLDKCLSSIKPILDNVDSELIITDTGSTDKTVEIARKYTDKILHFDWINDFSAARNFGLEKARGKWFMYLDADDIFESCDEIIDFFKSGDYKKYNSATYLSHNILSDNTYTDYKAARLTKLTDSTKFVGVVHEHLNTFNFPIKNIYDTALHYGYLYSDKSEAEKKYRRNSELLLLSLEKYGDDDPIIYSQLFECFMGHDREKASEYLDKGITICTERRHFLLTVMYCHKAYAFYVNHDYSAALNVCCEYFNIKKSIQPEVTSLDMEMYAIQASSLFELKRYSESAESFRYFFVIFNEVKKGKLNTPDLYAIQLRMAIDTKYIKYMCDFLESSIKAGLSKKALNFISNYPPTGYPYNDDEINRLVDIELQLIEHLEKDDAKICYNGLDAKGKELFFQRRTGNERSSCHVLLTIGMIVKNEEKWIDKCLSAIKPILDNVASELIITDTGSTDKTVEIARKYTDKILHFDWINDFSAARNFGLKKACGEWFMMLDADDIFRSCNHIIDFFNSGEYKKYNAATYISRNVIKEWDGDHYSDFSAPRLTKLYSYTRYENTIHEALNTFQPPYKNLKDIADHYGYYYVTEEQRQNKFKRNSELLLKRFETEKDTTPMLYVQLYEAFMGVKDYEKALEYLNGGIELSKKMNSIVLAALYFHKASYYQTEKNYECALSACDEYFKIDKAIRPYPLTTDGEIYAIMAMCLYELKKYSEAVDVFKKFFDVYRDIESGKLATYDRYLYSSYMCSDINIMPLFNHFINSCIKSEKFNTADSWLSTYPLHRYSFEPQIINELIQYVLTITEHLGYKSIEKYYQRLDDCGKKILLEELFGRSRNADNRELVLGAIGDISKSDTKTAKKLYIYKAYCAGENCLSELNDFIKQYGISGDEDIVYLLLKNNYDISPAISKMGLDIKKLAYICCKKIEGFYEAAESYNADLVSEINLLPVAVKFYDYCISMRLIENEGKTEEEKKQLIGRLFAVKSALNERYKKANAKSEFERLAESVKKNIRAYIAAENITAAKKTLEDYRKINPKDVEIGKLEAMLQSN